MTIRNGGANSNLGLLNELVNSDVEKPTRGQTRDWLKKRKEREGYFNDIIKEFAPALIDAKRYELMMSLITDRKPFNVHPDDRLVQYGSAVYFLP